MIETYLFPGFNLELQKIIRTIFVRAYFEPGDIILKPGQAIRSVMLIAKGNVKIFREDQDGNDFFLYQLGPGQACAYTLLLDSIPSTCKIMARAAEDCELWLLPLSAVQRWMTKYTCWNDFVIKTFQHHINQLMQVMDLVIFKGMDERLEYYLQSQRTGADHTCIQISHQEIANEMSTSREVISRLLKKMELNGKVKLHRNQIEWVR